MDKIKANDIVIYNGNCVRVREIRDIAGVLHAVITTPHRSTAHVLMSDLTPIEREEDATDA